MSENKTPSKRHIQSWLHIQRRGEEFFISSLFGGMRERASTLDEALALYWKNWALALERRRQHPPSYAWILMWTMYQPEQVRYNTMIIKPSKEVAELSISVASYLHAGQRVLRVLGFEDAPVMLVPADWGEAAWREALEKRLRQVDWAALAEGDKEGLRLWQQLKADRLKLVDAHVLLPNPPSHYERPAFPPILLARAKGHEDWYSVAAAKQELEQFGTRQRHRTLVPTAIGREAEVGVVLDYLSDPAARAPLAIIGPKGAGKKAVFREALRRYHQQRPAHEAWHWDLRRMEAGKSEVGSFDRAAEAILRQMRPRDADAEDEAAWSAEILLIDDLPYLTQAGAYKGGKKALDSILKPYWQSGQTRFVLLGSEADWQLFQERNRPLAGLCAVLRLPSMSEAEGLRVLLHHISVLELGGRAGLAAHVPPILRRYRHFHQQDALPGILVELLKQRLAQRSLDSAGEQPLAGKSLEERRAAIAQRLIGQPEAAEAMLNALVRFETRLFWPDRPIGTYLFVGPTGVGKTQAVKILARAMGEPDQVLLRLDMNEYVSAEAIHRLVGDGYGDEGLLTRLLRGKPMGILLLDEVEKAHARLRDLLLQLLDEGRISNAKGQVLDFRRFIIIMTSNMGAQRVDSTISFQNKDVAAIYGQAIREGFRPEFLNRIDEVVVFRPLDKTSLRQIAQLLIEELLRRDGFVRRGAILNIQPAVLAWVAEQSYDPRMGGRALKRRIEQDLTSLSAEQLLRLPADAVMLCDVLLEGEQIRTHIRKLRLPQGQMPPFPHYQDDNKAIRGYYEHFYQRFQSLHERLREEERPMSDWHFFAFKERLQGHLDTLNELLAKAGYFPEGTEQVFNYRLQQLGTELSADWLSEELLRDLDARIQHMSQAHNASESALLRWWAKERLASLELPALLADETDVLPLFLGVVNFDPAKGQPLVERLQALLAELAERLDWEWTLDWQPESERVWRAELRGWALRRILAPLAGTHLLVGQGQGMVKCSLGEAPALQADDLDLCYLHGPTGYVCDWRSRWVILGNAQRSPVEELFLLLMRQA